MIVSFDSAESGWGKYGLGRNGNRPGATLINGNPFLGDEISESTEYNSGQYIRMVISFYDELSPEKATEINDEFISLLMTGYRQDEYHADGVLHTDTDHNHIHMRIPKLNIFTKTQLKIYNHRTDLQRIETIKEYLVKKHGLNPTAKSIVTDPEKIVERIQYWRILAGEELFVFTKKGEHDREKMRLQNMALDLISTESVTSLADIKTAYVQMGLRISNEGYDRSEGEHFITVKNETGEFKLMGQIFGEKFYLFPRADQKRAISTGKQILREKSLSQIKEELDVLQGERTTFIEKTYRTSREKAEKREHELLKRAKSAAIKNPIKRSENYEQITIPKEIVSGEKDRRRTADAEQRARTENRERSVAEAIIGTEQAASGTEQRAKGYRGISEQNYRIIANERREHFRERRVQKAFSQFFTRVFGELRYQIGGIFHKIEAYRQPEIKSVLDNETTQSLSIEDDVLTIKSTLF